MARVFRVVRVLKAEELGRCFTVHGGLLRKHCGEVIRTKAVARWVAWELAGQGFEAFILRRCRNGWQQVEHFPAVECGAEDVLRVAGLLA